MAEPLDKGLPFTVIRWQLVKAVPDLMPIVSRTGNAKHTVARQVTCLQMIRRVHGLAVHMQNAKKDVDWEEIAKLAAEGMTPESAGRVAGQGLEWWGRWESAGRARAI